MQPRLVVIQGAPASGKTTLAEKIRQELPETIVISKDTLKELLFDILPAGDLEWSRLLGKISVEMLFSMAREFLASGRNVIIENAFYAEYARADVAALKVPVVEIFCFCDEDLRRERFAQRAHTIRHPGHMDKKVTNSNIDAYVPILPNEQTIRLDTTKGIDARNITEIVQKIKDHFNGRGINETTN